MSDVEQSWHMAIPSREVDGVIDFGEARLEVRAAHYDADGVLVITDARLVSIDPTKASVTESPMGQDTGR